MKGPCEIIPIPEPEEKETPLLTVRRPSELPLVRPLIDFGDTPPDPGKTLVGNRFLCREGGMLFVGPSGIGKTSAGVQQDLLWSIGLPAFGIVPAGPLKILTIQAEDDDGDLSEIVSGVRTGLQLSPEQCQQSRENCLYVTEKTHTGPEFLAKVVSPLLEKHRPELLRINPLQAYLGGDIKDPTVTAAFLRNALIRCYRSSNAVASSFTTRQRSPSGTQRNGKPQTGCMRERGPPTSQTGAARR